MDIHPDWWFCPAWKDKERHDYILSRRNHKQLSKIYQSSGFGKTTITVEVTCAEGTSATKTATGTVFLFFILGVK